MRSTRTHLNKQIKSPLSVAAFWKMCETNWTIIFSGYPEFDFYTKKNDVTISTIIRVTVGYS